MRVFVASRGGSVGTMKMLNPGYEARASQEVSVLQHLEKRGVTHILSGELVTNSTIYFAKVLIPVEVVSGRMVADLVSLLNPYTLLG